MIDTDIIKTLGYLSSKKSATKKKIVAFLGKERLEAIANSKPNPKSHPSQWEIISYYLSSRKLINIKRKKISITNMGEILLEYVDKNGGLCKLRSKCDCGTPCN